MKRLEKKFGLQRPFRRQHPVHLTQHELQLLINEVSDEPFRTMLIAAAFLGLRRSEVAALKWQDFSDEWATLTVRRSIGNGHVSEPKDMRHYTLPVPGKVAEAFKNLKASSAFNKDNDWVFADPAHSGAVPYDAEKVMRKHIRPAAARSGIQSFVGWHVLRQGYAAMLVSLGIDLLMVSRLMRHRNVLSTARLLPWWPGRLRDGSERLTSFFFRAPERQARSGETVPKSTAKNVRQGFASRASKDVAGPKKRKKKTRR